MIDEAQAGKPMPEARERGDLDNPSKIKRKELENRLERRRELADIAWVVSTPGGRRFYWRMLKRCKIFETSFTGNNTTFFNEGERNIGLILLSDLQQVAPEAYLEMMKESQQEDSHG